MQLVKEVIHLPFPLALTMTPMGLRTSCTEIRSSSRLLTVCQSFLEMTGMSHSQECCSINDDVSVYLC